MNFHSPRHLASAILEGVSPAFFQLLLACSSHRRPCHQGAAMQGSNALVQLAAVHPPSGHSSVSVCTSFVVHMRKSVLVSQQLESSNRQSVRSHAPIVITYFFRQLIQPEYFLSKRGDVGSCTFSAARSSCHRAFQQDSRLHLQCTVQQDFPGEPRCTRYCCFVVVFFVMFAAVCRDA